MIATYNSIFDTVKFWDKKSQLKLFNDLGLFKDLGQMMLSYQFFSYVDGNAEEEVVAKQINKNHLVFPKIPSGYKISPSVEAMTFGPLPEGFDIEKELDNMWEDRAK